MSMKSYLGEIGLLSALMAIGESPITASKNKEKISLENVDGKLPVKPIPKGCKEYYFNRNGGYNVNRDQYTVFYCIARNYNSAYRKFINWSKQKP